MKNNKKLVIVESPNKVKKISSFLGKDYIVRASYGHIMDLASTKANKLGVIIEQDYKTKYKILPNKKDKLSIIINAANSVSEILIATDPDREGEAIAFHLRQCLDTASVPIKRVTFNSMTKKAVVKAVNNPIELDEHVYMAQKSRRVIDRIVGFLVSPFLSEQMGETLSAGRVQSVAARLIIDREQEIKSFIPENYWNAFYTIKKEDKDFRLKYNGKINSEDELKSVKEKISTNDIKLIDIVKGVKEKSPPPPLITSKLQQLASSKLNMSVKDTMRSAQSLYEAGLITYLRTDSTRVDPEAQKECKDWLVAAGHKVPAKYNDYSTKKSAQDAHEAMRPTDIKTTPNKVFLSLNDTRVYTLIWQTFVQSQMTPIVYNTVDLKFDCNGLPFSLSGKTIADMGFFKVNELKENINEEILPEFNIGEFFNQEKFEDILNKTQAPSRYNEGTLVRELEKREIGRPSTYADIVDKIKSRGYVSLKQKKYFGTDLGEEVITLLTNYFKFLDYNYTATLEKNLDKVSDGKLGYIDMMDLFFKEFQKDLKRGYLDQGTDSEIACENCGDKMIVKHGMFGFYIQCINFDCKNTVSCDIVEGKPVIKEDKKEPVDGVKCPLCDSEMFKKDGKFGPFYSCVKYPACYGKRKVPFGKKCEKCSDEMYMTIFNGEMKLACMAYPNCKNIEELPDSYKEKWDNPNNYQVPEPSKKTKRFVNVKR